MLAPFKCDKRIAVLVFVIGLKIFRFFSCHSPGLSSGKKCIAIKIVVNYC
jgi:hypothetical protein